MKQEAIYPLLQTKKLHRLLLAHCSGHLAVHYFYQLSKQLSLITKIYRQVSLHYTFDLIPLRPVTT